MSWKRAPDFGREAGNGLFKYTSYAVDYPVFPPYSWVVEQVVLPLFVPFGWTVLVVEGALAVMLLSGAWVRLAAAIGIAQSLAIGLSVAYAPAEWPWSYWLMIGAHAVILLSSAGRVLAVDGVRAGLPGRRALGRFWGVTTTLVGLFCALASLGDPLAASGPGLRSVGLSLSLGQFNLVGGLILIAVGVLLILGSAGTQTASWAAAALSAVAGLSLLAQFGFTDPLLGGTPTSAAYLFTVAAVSLVVGARSGAPSTPSQHPLADPSKGS